MQVKILMRLM